jgi:DNA-directed RNA polymerase specialized sigma24 family protein
LNVGSVEAGASSVSNAGSVSHWIAQAKAGDEQSLARLHARYWPALVGLARQKLRGSPISSDEEDIAQQAFLGFYQAVQRQRLPQLENRHQFLALLSHIIACKACNQINHERTARNGGGRSRIASVILELLEDSSYSPLQEAILKECYELYVADMPDSLRPFAELFLQGHTREAIAAQLGCAERTVDRKLALAKDYWKNVARQCLLESDSAL